MRFEVQLPDWAIEENRRLPSHLISLEQRMERVIQFSRWNFERETGGPFAAGIFEKESGKVVVIGVNRVVPTNISSAHAEIVAISMAQTLLNTFDLSAPDLPEYQIVVNGRPCAMCYGSIPWSGIRSLVIGASGEQIESITGFDEGPIHPDWIEEYHRRGIEVIENVLNEQACQVFRDFANSNQPVYNALRGKGQRIRPEISS